MTRGATIKVSFAVLRDERVDEMCTGCATWSIRNLDLVLTMPSRMTYTSYRWCAHCKSRGDHER